LLLLVAVCRGVYPAYAGRSLAVCHGVYSAYAGFRLALPNRYALGIRMSFKSLSLTYERDTYKDFLDFNDLSDFKTYRQSADRQTLRPEDTHFTGFAGRPLPDAGGQPSDCRKSDYF